MSTDAEQDDQVAPIPRPLQLRHQSDDAGLSRLALVAIATVALIAAIALGLSIWALVRSDGPAGPTAQQVADAKGRACSAYNTVRKAVALQTQPPQGDDPAAAQSVATNARMAMAIGSQHLVDNLDPAVPPELAGLLRSLATDLQGITINALAGNPDTDPDQVARLQGLEKTSTRIVELCK
jgi:hypothetical protein